MLPSQTGGFLSKHPSLMWSLPALLLLTVGFIFFRDLVLGEPQPQSSEDIQYSQPISENIQQPQPTSDFVPCPKSGHLPREDYLPTYVVKEGDTLLSISQNELGDTSRVQEIINLNINSFPQLSVESPFLEQGWKLYLPPKNSGRTNGMIIIIGGRVKTSDLRWGLSWQNAGAGPFDLNELPSGINDGDCAVVVYQGRDIEDYNSDIRIIEVLRQ